MLAIEVVLGKVAREIVMGMQNGDVAENCAASDELSETADCRPVV